MTLIKEPEALIDIIRNSPHIHKIAIALRDFKTEDCYIGAGAIAQTVWNVLTNRPVDYGIDDIDIVFYNKQNLEERSEDRVIEYLCSRLDKYPFKLDVKNEARVHLWYRDKFGYDIEPYKSIESAINAWPTTATSLCLRMLSEKEWEIYAPFGLNDLFDMKLVANNRQITEEIYNKKVKKWVQKWPELNVVPWDNKLISFAVDRKIYITNLTCAKTL